MPDTANLMRSKRSAKHTIYRFDQMAQQINDRVDNPAESGVERYVGLEHLDAESLSIRRWGAITDVESTKLRFQPGDIIFGKRRVYQRKLSVADFEGICSAHAMVLRAKHQVILPEFLPFFMQSDHFMKRALEISVGSLSPTINWNTLAAEKFALPPIEEQRRVAAAMMAAEQSIGPLKELSAAIEAMREPLATRTIWKNQPPITRGTLPDTASFPANWKIASLGDVVSFVGGSQPPQSTFRSEPGNGYVRLLQIRDYKTDEYLTFIPEEFARKKCKPDDIMIGRYGPPLFQILRGLEGAYNVALMKAVPDENQLDKEYLYHFLRQKRLHDLIDHLSTRSAGQAGVEMDVLKNYVIPLPSKAEQASIVEQLDFIDKLLVRTYARIENAKVIQERIMMQSGIGVDR